MTRHVVICTDGTWNTPDQKDRGRVVASNVVKLSRALSGYKLEETGKRTPKIKQLLYYDTGVGTGGRWDRIKGGAFGAGLSKNVLQAYTAIGEHYEDGDLLFLFGFSRGAFTARSLAGLIGLCGIPKISEDTTVASVAQKAYEIYRKDPVKRKKEREKAAGDHSAKFSRLDAQSKVVNEVWFVGVWDTVGAMGVPLQKLNWIGRRKHKFHEVSLGEHVQYAYHAVAIDERRRPFKPTLWLAKNSNSKQKVEQLWFPGVHSNIGGGYVDAGLSDRALLWMCAKANAAGLAFRADYMNRRLDPNYHGELRDSLSLGYKALVPFLRPIGEKWKSSNDGKLYSVLKEGIHYSAVDRFKHATEANYRNSPGTANLVTAMTAKTPPVKPAIPEEANFHLGARGISWDGDDTSPERIRI